MMNAIEAMASVTGRPRKLVVRSERHDDDVVRVAVHDTGVGLQASDVDRVFSAFHHEAGRRGHGAVDQPLHHRVAPRPAVGGAQRGARRDFQFSLPIGR